MSVPALVVLALAAVGGVVMVVLRLRTEANPPFALAVAHGALAAIGLVLAVLGARQTGFSGTSGGAVGLLVLAALGGFVLFATHLRGRQIPLPLVGVHAGAAVVGVVLLVLTVAAGR